MTKKIEIDICKNRLKISKEKFKSTDTYLIYHSDLLLYIHADILKFGQHDIEQGGWLMFCNADNTYIGSVWINADTDMKKVEQFLEETK